MYRENISEFIQGGKLYLPKETGLNSFVLGLLPEIGVNRDGVITKEGVVKGTLELILCRGTDIPRNINDDKSLGIVSYGLLGDNLLDNYLLQMQAKNEPCSISVLNTYDWYDEAAQFNRPTLCLMNRSGQMDFPENPRIAVNNKYYFASEKYLKEKIPSAIIAGYDGDVEFKVKNGRIDKINDGCVEIVYRGNKSPDSAIMKAGLKIVDIVRFSDLVLVGGIENGPWAAEYERILGRKRNPTGSYTSRLLQDKNEIVKKIGQEQAELVYAFCEGKNIKGESLDVIYGVMVLLASTNIPWAELENEVKKRWK